MTCAASRKLLVDRLVALLNFCQTSKKHKYAQLHSHDKQTHKTLCSEIRRTLCSRHYDAWWLSVQFVGYCAST